MLCYFFKGEVNDYLKIYFAGNRIMWNIKLEATSAQFGHKNRKKSKVSKKIQITM